MAFRARRQAASAIVKSLREAGRDRDPTELQFYPSKNPETVTPSRTGQTYSAAFQGMNLPARQLFQLKRLGKPFNYQGVITKQYTTKTLCLLFGIERVTLHRWMKAGIMPRPMVVVANSIDAERSYWFYHQVQPVFIWYMYLRSRGIKRIAADDNCRFSELVKNLKRSQIRFEKLLGIEQIDEYTLIAGNYGVIPID